MAPVLIKVYAALHPADEACAAAVREGGRDAVGNDESPWLFHEKELLRISFEGQYFPEEAVLRALAGRLPPDAEGKLDLLDLEKWELRRFVPQGGRLVLSRRPLNHVLAYSGH
jgi:hypothetical protein